MRVFYSAFQVDLKNEPNQKSALRRRDGFLLKIESEDDAGMTCAGYACCQPVPEFEDLKWQQYLTQLQNGGEMLPLLQQTLRFAEIDFEARRDKRSLWQQARPLHNHLTVTSLEQLEALIEKPVSSHTMIKIKCGRDAKAEVSLINDFVKRHEQTGLRLDFNQAGADDVLGHLNEVSKARIDFIEDPEPYSQSRWLELRRRFGVALALDEKVKSNILNYNPGSGIDVVVMKPARENVFDFMIDPAVRVVFTSSLDHPVSQAFAQWQAGQWQMAQLQMTPPQSIRNQGSSQAPVQRQGRLSRSEICGLQTHSLIEPTPYHQAVIDDGNQVYYRGQLGIGFDEQLAREPWTEVAI